MCNSIKEEKETYKIVSITPVLFWIVGQTIFRSVVRINWKVPAKENYHKKAIINQCFQNKSAMPPPPILFSNHKILPENVLLATYKNNSKSSNKLCIP